MAVHRREEVHATSALQQFFDRPTSTFHRRSRLHNMICAFAVRVVQAGVVSFFPKPAWLL